MLRLATDIRKDLPRIGTAKLHFMLEKPFAEHGIKLGRDGLYALLDRHGLLMRKRKRKARTTDSGHPYRKYPNLIRELKLSCAGQLWVSDITYLRLPEGFCYLSIITDAYSHKIVGYSLQPGLHATGPLRALAMATTGNVMSETLIHHSDRGVQYCCGEYVDALGAKKIRMSMTENGDPYENAIAERVNGILKDEFELDRVFGSVAEAEQAVASAVDRYNTLRPHASCDYRTPEQAHGQEGPMRKRWSQPSYKVREQAAQPGDVKKAHLAG